MEPVIAIFFDNNRTYIALLEPDAKGFSLAYINSTTTPVDFSQAEEITLSLGAHEVRELLAEIAGAASKVSVTLPMESVFVHQFPAPLDLSADEVKELVEFEISQHFSHQDVSGFHSIVYPMSPRLDQTRMMLAVIIEKNMLTAVEQLLSMLGADSIRTEVAQLATHNAYAYNYPESHGTFAIFGVQGRYIDVSVIRNGEIAYYQLVPMNDHTQIGSICEQEIQKILEEYVPFIDTAFFFGSQLNKTMLDNAAASLSIPVHRLNAFRMLTTTLGERERAYCTRVAHILPPCVGGALPPLQEGTIV